MIAGDPVEAEGPGPCHLRAAEDGETVSTSPLMTGARTARIIPTPHHWPMIPREA
jgi:hypothetical protein